MAKPSIAIVDYGMGNLRSVFNALTSVAPEHEISLSADAAVLAAADRLVIPGQGAARDCLNAMNQAGIAEAIPRWIAQAKPILGICMGLQLLFESSEENQGTPCLGVYPGVVKRFETDAQGVRKVPQMGWNPVKQSPHPLWADIDDHSHFYFAHSYYVCPTDPQLSIGRTEYGIEYCSAIARDSVFATQFHPEKSADAGLQLLKNFVNWNPPSKGLE